MRSVLGRHIAWFMAVFVSLAGMRISYELVVRHLNLPASQGAEAQSQKAPKQEAPKQEEPSQEDPSRENGNLGLFDAVCTTWFENADCDAVTESEWGVIRFGRYSIPSANLGLFYFTAVFCWLLLIACPTPSRWWVHLLLMMGVACGFGSSIFFMIQMSKLEVWCPLCTATHLANGLLFVTGLLMWPRAPKVKPATEAAAGGPPSAGNPWPHGWMLLVTPVVILLAINVEGLALRSLTSNLTRDRLVAKTREQTIDELKEKIASEMAQLSDEDLAKELKKAINAGENREAELKKKLVIADKTQKYYKKQFERYNTKWQHTLVAWQITPPVYIETENEPVRGPENAKHTVVIFSDFECSSCRQFEDIMKTRIVPLANQYGGIRIIYKQWPICIDCNPTAINNLHPLACKAALAAEAAFMVGGSEAFWKMHDLLYSTQKLWKKKQSRIFSVYANRIGLDVAAFDRAFNSKEAMDAVKSDIQEGMQLGLGEKIDETERDWIKVHSTPSTFVDYKRLNALNHVKTWRAIFQGAAQPKPKQPPPITTQAASSGATKPAADK